jgi:hypothetical protein
MAEKLYELLTIGEVKVHRLAEVAFSVKYKSKRKIDEKAADGTGDATATDKGREVREVTISLSWPDLPRLNATMGPICKTLDPGGPDGGKPFEFSHIRNGLDMGDIKAVRSVLFKDADGPNVEPGSGEVKVEYTCDSWAKPDAKPAAGKTPSEDDKKKSDPESPLPFGAEPTPTPAGQINQAPPEVKP